MTQEIKKQIISSVGMLDIRTATEETLSRIHRIGSAGTIICSPETAPFLTRISIGSVGSIIEAPHNAKLVTGQLTFNKDSFNKESEPQNFLVVGQVLIESELSAEDLNMGLGELSIVGLVICPEHLSGVLQSKTKEITGQVHYYTHTKPKISVGTLNFNENYLNALEDGSELLVVGKLDMLDVLPNDVMNQKLAKLSAIGKVTLREENAEVFYAKSETNTTGTKVTVIPAGYEWFRQDIKLDAVQMGALPGRKLYCTGMVRIEDDVTADMLEGAIDHLTCTDTVLCPEGLKPVLAKKCDLLNTQVAYYQDQLWVVEDKMELTPARLDYLEGQYTLVVLDRVTIHPDVTPDSLAERFVKIHTFDRVTCTPEQMGVLQARLGIDKGSFSTPKPEKDKEKSKTDSDLYERIGGVGTLKL